MGTFKKISNDMAKEIVEIYTNSDYGVHFLGKKYNRSPTTINKVLIASGIKRRTRKELGQIYRANRYDKITDDIAWLLGYIATDGHIVKGISTRGGCVEISSKDIKLLKRAREICNKQHIKLKKRSQHLNQKRLRLADTSLVELCNKVGIPSGNKTFILGRLKIPKDNFIPFLCGVIDGDGNKRSKSRTFEITSASKKFLIGLREELNDLGYVVRVKKYKCESDRVINGRKCVFKPYIYKLTCGVPTAMKIAEQIIKNNYFLLERKKWWLTRLR